MYNVYVHVHMYIMCVYMHNTYMIFMLYCVRLI